MIEKIFTNCFLVKSGNNGKPEEVCLAWKKRGFGKGMWNGAGGKPNEGESVEDAAKREAQEELEVKITDLNKRGEIHFILRKEKQDITMHVYLITKWVGTPKETEEMKPKWFKIKDIPYVKMWEADRAWLPYIFAGKTIKAKYTYAKEGGKAESGQIEEVKGF